MGSRICIDLVACLNVTPIRRKSSLDSVQLPKHELAPYCLVNTQDNHMHRRQCHSCFAENPCQIFLWRDVLTKHVGGDNWWSFGRRRTLIPHVCFSVQPCSVAIRVPSVGPLKNCPVPACSGLGHEPSAVAGHLPDEQPQCGPASLSSQPAFWCRVALWILHDSAWSLDSVISRRF